MQKNIYLIENYYKGTQINNVCGTCIFNSVINFDLLKQFSEMGDDAVHELADIALYFTVTVKESPIKACADKEGKYEYHRDGWLWDRDICRTIEKATDKDTPYKNSNEEEWQYFSSSTYVGKLTISVKVSENNYEIVVVPKYEYTT